MRILIGTFLTFFFLISCQNLDKKNIDNEIDIPNEQLDYKKIETNNSLDLKYQIIDEYNQQVPFYKLKQIAEYPGGFDSLEVFIQRNFIFPELKENVDIVGQVRTTFSVDTLGKVIEIKIIKGFLKDIDQSCLEVLSKMPDWKPAKIDDNKKVKMRFELPLKFVTEE